MSHQHTPVSASVNKSTSRFEPKPVPRKKQAPNVPAPRPTPVPTVEENDEYRDDTQVESWIDPSLQVNQPTPRTSQRRVNSVDEIPAPNRVGIPVVGPSTSSSDITPRSIQPTSSTVPARTLRSSGPVSQPTQPQFVHPAVPTSSATVTTETSRKRRSSPRRNLRKSTPPSAEQVEISPATMTMSEMCIDKRTGRKSARYGELQDAERQRKRLRQLKRGQEANEVQNTQPPPPDPALAATTMTEVIPSLEEDDSLLPVTSGTAQVMTDSEGNIILDRTSIRVDLHAVHPTTLADSLIHTTETVFSSKTNSSTYPSTRKHASNTIRWLPADNEHFYNALQMFGTDFAMVADYLGGGKTRRHVKNKFDREEKKDPDKLTWALKNRVEPDIAGLEEMRGRRIRRMDDVELKETLAGIREEGRAIMALPSLSQSQGNGVERTSILD